MTLAPPAADPAAWERVTDPDGAFTVFVPRGWTHRAWLQYNGAHPHGLVTATDGRTSLFLSDPRLPMFVAPGGFPSPGAVVRPYTSVEHFLPEYVQGRFGALPGFRIVGMRPEPDLFQLVGEGLSRAGATQLWVTAGRLGFEHDGGRAVVIASCASLGGVWFADVHGVHTDGDPDAWVPALIGMLATRAATPETHRRQMQERAASAAQHAATMASLSQSAAFLRQSHASSMAAIDQSARAHHQRMDDLHASHDAANAAWSAQQARYDAPAPPEDEGHRRFLNLIAGERTVVDPDGHPRQVEDGYDRYFRRRSDDAVIGVRGDRDLSGLPGIDPADFDELRVRR